MIGLIADAFSSDTSASTPEPLGIKYIVKSGLSTFDQFRLVGVDDQSQHLHGANETLVP